MHRSVSNLIGAIMMTLMTGCSAETNHQENQFPRMSPLYLYQNTEELANVRLKVTGHIPEWVQGEFVRNGPGLIQGHNVHVRSWFDGLAKLHAFSIQDGQVTYTCKFLQSEAYKQFQKTGKLDFAGFAQIGGSFSLIDFIFGSKNDAVMNANVNVARIDNRLVALTETPLPVEFDRSVGTLGFFDYSDGLPKKYSFESAHALQDPETQGMWNFLINIGLFDTAYQIYHIPPSSSERKLVASIPVSAASYMHSFSLAGRYLILVDYPLRAKDPKDMAKGFIDAFAWYENEPTVIYIIDKESGEYSTLSTEPFFSFHHINGFEKDGKLYLDLVVYPNADIIYKVNKYPFVDHIENKFWRLEVDPREKAVKIISKSNEQVEFPRLNESHIGKDYRYFYAVHIKPDGHGLIKYNQVKPQHAHWFEKGTYAMEPIFIPHPNAKTEDDGVVLSVVNDLNAKKSYLLILEAKELTELARVEAPHFIPFGFHGQFFK